MPTLDPAGEQFSRAEKVRELRLRLSETVDEPQRHIILRQIEELEGEAQRSSLE